MIYWLKKPSISATTETGKKSFAENYLNKIGGGGGGGSSTINNGRNEKELIFQLLKVLIGKKLD